jgi:outer membrane lipoprotein-sorting protein
MLKSTITALLVLPLFAATAYAQSPSASAAERQPEPGRQADIATIEGYLNGLTTAQADFTSVAPDGAVSRGAFYLSRPDRLRFEYTDPKGNLLIADGDYVIFWDAGQKEESNLPIGQTPLAFLLKPKISLTDGLRILGYEHSAGIIRIQLARDQDSGDGTVTVAFSDQPLELRGWRLIDGQGQITDVSFSNWRFGMSLAMSLFHFDDPRQGKRGR